MRVEGTDHVVAIQAEVQREVVARAGRDHHHRHAVFGGDGGDEGLRSVASGHANGVRSIGDRLASEGPQVVARLENDGPDSTLTARVDQIEPLRLPAAGLQVHDEHSALGRRHRLARGRPGLERPDGEAERVAGQHDREDEHGYPQDGRDHLAYIIEQRADHDAQECDGGDDHSDRSPPAIAADRHPRRADGDHEERGARTS